MMDINKLRELASKADEGYSGTHPRDSNNWEANRDFCCAFTPATALALLDVAEKAREAMKGANRDAWDAFRTSLAALGEQGK
jgi:hypothetical protein